MMSHSNSPRLTWRCSVCGFEYSMYPYFSPLHNSNDCSEDFNIMVSLPQGWSFTNYGLMCSKCVKDVDTFIQNMRDIRKTD